MTKPGEAWRGALIGAAYAVLYFALKETPANINASAALRIAALVVLAPKRWKWIIAGDVLVNFLYALPRLGPVYGPLSLAACSLLPALFAIPAAALGWRIKVTGSARSLADVGRLTTVAAIGAVSAATAGLLITNSYGWDIASAGYTQTGLWAIYAAGVLLPSIVALPLAHILVELADRTRRPLRYWVKDHEARALLLMVSVAGLGCLVLWAHRLQDTHALQWIRLALVIPLPIFVLAWRSTGAVLGITASMIALELSPIGPTFAPTTGALLEQSLLYWQAAGSCIAIAFLAIGAAYERQSEVTRAAQQRARAAEEAAANSAVWPERMREYHASLVDDLLATIEETEELMRSQELSRAHAQRAWWITASAARQSLRDRQEAIRSPLIDAHGIRAALAGGPLVHAMQEAGITYHPRLTDRVSHLSKESQHAAYHLLHEALSALMRAGPLGTVELRLRAGISTGMGGWIAINLTSSFATDSPDRYTTARAQKLAIAYGGSMRSRVTGSRHIATIVVPDRLPLQVPARHPGAA